MKSNVFICPPCGESVAQATKEGQNKNKALWPLLPRLTAVLPPQGREMSFGFTLIELLVVVLIIGILAAVAVPQYQKAVEKARAAEGIALIRTVAEAEQAYHLANGEYTTNFNDLDVGFEAAEGYNDDTAQAKHVRLYLWRANTHNFIYAQAVQREYANWLIYYNLADNKLYCGSRETDTNGQAFCKTLGKGEAVACADIDAIKCYQIY